MKPYTVTLMPVDRKPYDLHCATLLDALCLVAWANSKATVKEYETPINLYDHRDLLAHIEATKGTQCQGAGK